MEMTVERVLFVHKDGYCERIEGNVKYKKGVFLTEGELDLLKLLYHCGSLTSSLVHLFCNTIYGEERKSQYISARLTKLVDMGILYRKVRVLGNNFSQYYYKLKYNGYRVLKYIGEIEEEWSESMENKLYKTESFSKHKVSLLKVIGEIYLLLSRDIGDTTEFTITKGKRHSLFCERNQVEGLLDNNHRINPDYVIESNDILICYEHDMKSEALNKIEKKNELYIQLAQKDICKKKLVVLYGIEQVNVKSELGNTRRIHSIMNSIPLAKEWEDHMQFYVIDNRYSAKLVKEVLKGDLPISQISNQSMNQRILKYIKEIVSKKQGLFEQVEPQWLNFDVSEGAKSNKDVEDTFYIQLPGEAQRSFVLISMTLGDVVSYQKACRIYQHIHQTNCTSSQNTYLPIELLIGLWHGWEAEEVLLPFHPIIQISTFSYEDWLLKGLLNKIYRKKSMFKKNEGKLFEEV